VAGLPNSTWLCVRPVIHLRRLFISWCRWHQSSTTDYSWLSFRNSIRQTVCELHRKYHKR